MVKRFTEEVQITPQNLSTGAAQGQLSLADRLDAFSSSTKSLQATIGTKVGQAEAAETPTPMVNGKPAPPEERKIGVADALLTGGARTKAYNQTLRDGYLAALENDSRLHLANIESENPDDLTGYNSQVEGYVNGVLQGVDPSARPAVQEFLNSQVTSSRIRIQAAALDKAELEAVSSVEEAIASSSNEAYTRSRAGNPEGSAEALLDTFSSIDGLLENGHIDSARAAEWKRDVERESTEQGFRFRLDAKAEAEGVDAAMAELEAMRNDVPGGWSPDEWDTFVKSARSDLSRLNSQQSASNAAMDARAREMLDQYQTAVGLGFDVDPAQKAEMVGLITGDEALEQRFSIIEDIAAFSLSSLASRDAMLGELQTGSLGDVALFEAATVANNTVNAMALDDGYSLGVNQGLIETIPFSIEDAASFAARIDQSEMLSSHYGVEVSPLTSGEAQALTDGLGVMTTPEKISLAMTLSQAPAVWGQIADREGGTFAMAGATGDTTVMTNVFQGQELIDADLAKAPSPTDYLQDFADFVEGVYGPEDAKNLMNSAIAYYVNSSDRSGEYDASDFEDAITAVSGGIGKINGFKLELPRGVDEDDFEDLIDDMQPETVADFGGVIGLTDQEAAEIIRQGRIRSVKSNQYIVETSMGTLFKADGSPFIIEWSEEIAGRNEARRHAAVPYPLMTPF